MRRIGVRRCSVQRRSCTIFWCWKNVWGNRRAIRIRRAAVLAAWRLPKSGADWRGRLRITGAGAGQNLDRVLGTAGGLLSTASRTVGSMRWTDKMGDGFCIFLINVRMKAPPITLAVGGAINTAWWPPVRKSSYALDSIHSLFANALSR